LNFVQYFPGAVDSCGNIVIRFSGWSHSMIRRLFSKTLFVYCKFSVCNQKLLSKLVKGFFCFQKYVVKATFGWMLSAGIRGFFILIFCYMIYFSSGQGIRYYISSTGLIYYFWGKTFYEIKPLNIWVFIRNSARKWLVVRMDF